VQSPGRKNAQPRLMIAHTSLQVHRSSSYELALAASILLRAAPGKQLVLFLLLAEAGYIASAYEGFPGDGLGI
jgi:hypothetical protein